MTFLSLKGEGPVSARQGIDAFHSLPKSPLFLSNSIKFYDYSNSTLANQLPFSEFFSDSLAVQKFNLQDAHPLKILNANTVALN